MFVLNGKTLPVDVAFTHEGIHILTIGWTDFAQEKAAIEHRTT